MTARAGVATTTNTDDRRLGSAAPDVGLEAPRYFTVKKIQKERRPVFPLTTRNDVAVLVAIDDVFAGYASTLGEELGVTFEIPGNDVAQH